MRPFFLLIFRPIRFFRRWEQTVDMEAQPADVDANIGQLNLQSTPMVSSPSQVQLPIPVPSVIRQVSLDGLVHHLENLYEREADAYLRGPLPKKKSHSAAV